MLLILIIKVFFGGVLTSISLPKRVPNLSHPIPGLVFHFVHLNYEIKHSNHFTG